MEELQEQVYRLEAQIKEISQSPHKVAVSVETTPKTTPTKDQGGSPVSLFIYLLLFIYLFIIIIIIILSGFQFNNDDIQWNVREALVVDSPKT